MWNNIQEWLIHGTKRVVEGTHLPCNYYLVPFIDLGSLGYFGA